MGDSGGAAAGFANTADLPARLRDAGVAPERVEDLLAGRAVEGLNFRLVVNMPGRVAGSWVVEPGAPRTIDVASSVSHRARPGLLGVAVLAGFGTLFRLRRQSRQS